MMKIKIKPYSLLIIFLLCTKSIFAQSKGVEIVCLVSYHSNIDVETEVEKNKRKVDNLKNEGALYRVVAKSQLTKKIRNQHKKTENKRLVEGLHDGESRQYMKLDTDSNRMAVFSPQHGRVIMTDWKNGRMIMAYPKLKTAINYTLNVNVAKRAGSVDVLEFLETDSIPTGVEIAEVNGFRAMQRFAYRDVEDGTGPENTMVIKGRLKEVFPMSGYLLTKNEYEYYTRIYVEGSNNNEKETIEGKLEMFKETTIDDSNFILPKDYKILTSQKEIDKKLMPLLQKNKQVMEDPSEMPNIFW